MKKEISPKKDIEKLKEKDQERIVPTRNYFTLEDDKKRLFLENGQKIETF